MSTLVQAVEPQARMARFRWGFLRFLVDWWIWIEIRRGLHFNLAPLAIKTGGTGG